MSCETCGREIKNYGMFLGGIRCANWCKHMETKAWRRHYDAGYDDGYEGRAFDPQGNSDDTHIAYEEGFNQGYSERNDNES